MKTPPAAGVQLEFSGTGLLQLQFTGDGLLLTVPQLYLGHPRGMCSGASLATRERNSRL